MKITLGRQIEEIKKKDSENEKNLLKNRNSDELNEVDADDIYFHSNTIKNIKLGSNTVNRIYLNNSIVYELQDAIDLNLFHSLVPQTATSIIFDKIENQVITNYNLVGYCDANNHIAVYNNSTSYLVLNIRNADNFAPVSCINFFRNYSQIRSLKFLNFNTDNVTDMRSMFNTCSSLTTLDLRNFNTENVIYMNSMFYFCAKLTSLNVSSFNTNNVISMSIMFYICESLTTLDLRNFNTENVNQMGAMFFGSKKLQKIISNTFNVSKVTSSYSMFQGCNVLKGGNGTTYNSSHINSEYARVDGENGLPGYFTAPANNK